MNVLVWGLEWRLALANRRDLTFRVLGPLSLAWVFASGGLPEGAGATAYVALFVGTGALGAALPLVRDVEAGIAARVLRSGISPASYLLQRAAAAAALAFVGLLPALAVVLAFLGPSLGEGTVLVAVLALGLWVASLVGVALASLSRSRAEVLLLSAVALVLLLHVSGAFHTPTAGGFTALLEAASPFKALHEAFAAPSSGAGVGGVPAAVVWAVLGPVLVGMSAAKLTTDPARAG